jgi:CO/xanthine dehydrogenase FAD-binding subunit
MSLYPIIARPTKLDQAGEVLEAMSSGLVVIAGGQELMPHVNYGVLQPEVFVDITALGELRGISEEGGVVSIGALSVHREVFTDAIVNAKIPLLAEAMRQIGGGRQVHNRATIGGNIVAMHPLYDVIPPLLALGASVEWTKAGEVRQTLLADLINDPRHGLGAEAILIRVLVPAMKQGCGHAYEKLKSSGGAYGSANAAVAVTLEGGRIASLAVAMGGAADKVVDASEALGFCVGQPWTDALGARVERACADQVREPLSDQQGDGEWRKAMAGLMVRRAIARAVAMAGQE